MASRLGGKSGNIYGERGEFYQHLTDLAIPGRPGASDLVQYALTREYRSAVNSQGPMGNHWDHIYFERLESVPDGSVVDHNGLGRNDHYLLNNVGDLVAPPELFTRLVRHVGGSFTLTLRDGSFKNFDTAGKLTQITDPNGNQGVPDVKPPWRDDDQTIGLRTGSRPRPCPGTCFSHGS